MKSTKLFAFTMILSIIFVFSGCSKTASKESTTTPIPTLSPQASSSGNIYLYGELHAVEKILDRELELWNEYYHNQNMRHLFIETPYYTAEFLNLWMQSENNDILDEVYNNLAGTYSAAPCVKEFYKKIKSEYPETIFHGTDIGHQYNSTGKQFLKYLEENNLKDSEQYQLTLEAIEQGNYYYQDFDDVYRENKMTENFVREYAKLTNENIMGIHGEAHTLLDAFDYNTRSVPCMGNQLNKRYDGNLYSESLSYLAKDIDPFRIDTIRVNGVDYKAAYFGIEDISTVFKDYISREFWRLENAYSDFKDKPKTSDHLPYSNYPMLIEIEQIFVIDYTKTDGTIIRKYYRSDGGTYNGELSTEEFIIE